MQRGVRFGYVGIDGGYGKDAAFLRGVDYLDCTFVADVHCRQMIYREDPASHILDWNDRGRQPKHLKAQCDAIRVDQWVSEQPDIAWRRIKGLSINNYPILLVFSSAFDVTARLT